MSVEHIYSYLDFYNLIIAPEYAVTMNEVSMR